MMTIAQMTGERRMRSALQDYGLKPVQVKEKREKGPFPTLSELLLAVRKDAIARTGAYDESRMDSRLRVLQQRSNQAAGSSEIVPGDGGFLVQADFANRLAKKVYKTGELLSRMTEFPLTRESATGIKIPAFDEQSRADGSRFGGVKSYWANEAETVTPSRPKYRLMELALHKIIAISYATDELVRDAALLDAVVSYAFINEFRYKLEMASLFGNGAGQPLGILDPSNQTLITIPKESGQAAGTIISQNVLKMSDRLWAPSRPNAIWLVSQDALPQLRTLTVSVGDAGSQLPLYTPPSGGEEYARLDGLPMIISEYSSQLGTFGDIVLADFSQVLFTQKKDIEGAVSIHVNFDFDEQVFKFTWRLDSQPMWHVAVQPANGGATLSPYISLAART